MGLEAFKQWQKEKKRADKKAAKEAPLEQASQSEPFKPLTQSPESIAFEAKRRSWEANEHITPVDPDEDD